MARWGIFFPFLVIITHTLTAVKNQHLRTRAPTTSRSTRKPLSPVGNARSNITVCLFVERGNDDLMYDYDKAAAGIDLAVDYLNENILPETLRLVTEYVDIGNKCTAKNSVVSFAMDLWQRPVSCDVYIGPGCGAAAENLYNFADFFQTPIIGCPAAGVGISAPSSEYPLLLRMSISFSVTAKVIFTFFAHFNYTDVVFFEDTSDVFYEQVGHLVEITMKETRPDLLYTVKFKLFDSTKTDRTGYRAMLTQAQQTARVHVIFGDSDTVRSFMRAAYHLGYTDGNTVFVALELFSAISWGHFSWQAGDDFDDNAFQAYQTLEILGLEDTISSAMDVFEQEVIHVSKVKYNRTVTKSEITPIVTHFYDAIVLYGSLVVDLLAQGKDFRDGAALGDLGINYSFISPLNGEIQLDENGDRKLYYVLKSLNPDSGGREATFKFSPDGGMAQLGRLCWPGQNGSFPPNVPKCGFKNDMCKPVVRGLTHGEKAGEAVGILVVCGMIIAAGLYGRKSLESLSDPYWWKIFVSELHRNTGDMNDSSERSLNETSTVKLESGSEAHIIDGKTMTAEASNHRATVKLALYKGTPVSLQELFEPKYRTNQAIINEAASVRRMQHPNLQKIYGIAINDDNFCHYIVGEACPKGSITDLILSDSRFDWPMKFSLIKDVVAGMAYLHGGPTVSFGWLTSHSCLIDSRLVAKISDYEFTCFRREEDLEPPSLERTDRDFELLLWRAPELLRGKMPLRGTQKGDIYSFAILLQQIFLRTMPYRVPNFHRASEHFKTMEITLEVKHATTPPMRPRVAVSAVDGQLFQLMELCWDEAPVHRPTFPRVKALFRNIVGKAGDNVVDHLVRTLDKEARDLEHRIDGQTRLYLEEKTRVDHIMNQILPRAVTAAMTRGEAIAPESFISVTAQVGDVCNFPEVAKTLTPFETVTLLNRVHAILSGVLDASDAVRIESFADSIATVSGVPRPNGGRHAFEICLTALAIWRDLAKIIIHPDDIVRLRFRAGIHSGPCVAAIVGTKLPKYWVAGDAVYVANQLKIEGEDGKIHISEATKHYLDQMGGFPMIQRGTTNIKGHGAMKTYWLIGSV